MRISWHVRSFRSDEGERFKTIKTMADQIIHRGPNDVGYCNDYPVLLGHRRLSIIELSNAGAQPMSTHDQRYTVVYNGEIYNHLKLRQRLS